MRPGMGREGSNDEEEVSRSAEVRDGMGRKTDGYAEEEVSRSAEMMDRDGARDAEEEVSKATQES